jgi:hypothetical protein
MTRKDTMDRALRRLSRCVPMLDIIRGDFGLSDKEVYDLTFFETDIPVNTQGMYCGPESKPESVYRNGYRFAA